ncbi:molybdate ABC transporter substrate-binding protein [Falsirhodobacter deserti]|uniref:molybdate ABC transporter substrate-binding protein n=1 Tax=Falsirhodobacter deserti TaxID=1365611 RepID=UPI000FE37B73|nr:molybdate ABC transporter substrate-binding protein [Falsirhodobacter deserti]
MQRGILACAFIAACGAAQAEDVTVFAAASLRTALDQIAADWSEQTGDNVTLSYAGSAQLAKQIMQGAPADIFISASTAWMDEAESSNAIAPQSRRNLLGNALVLIAAAGGQPVALSDLPAALGDEHLAMALVKAVPAGIYGRQALSHLGLWDAVSDHVAQADDVRGALALVAMREVPFGVVYASDAAAEPRVQITARFPAESHDAIVYPAAQVEGSMVGGAFLEYLSSDNAAAVFRQQGFEVLR